LYPISLPFRRLFFSYFATYFHGLTTRTARINQRLHGCRWLPH